MIKSGNDSFSLFSQGFSLGSSADIFAPESSWRFIRNNLILLFVQSVNNDLLFVLSIV